MKILVAGDFCPRDRVASILEKGDYASVFGNVKEIVSQADYSIVNLECPVVDKNATPIEKCGPNLKTTVKGVEALRWTGFNCVTLANNHFYDYGDEGVKSTLEACDMYGIDTVGGGNNLTEASRILYKQISGQTLAIVNCCEHEFSIATETTGGSNPLNPIQQYYAIQEARSKSDYVLVIVHGGHEHWQLPSPRMVETYRFFVDAGADAVVNHHQHCYSGYEVYKGKPIFYGLGNFCFDINPLKSNDNWNYGYFVQLFFEEDGIKYEWYPYEQCGEKVEVRLLLKDSFVDHLKSINEIISNDDSLQRETKSYYTRCENEIRADICPVTNRYYRAAVFRGWVPSLLSRKRFPRWENIICCEAHRDKLQFFFNGRLK